MNLSIIPNLLSDTVEHPRVGWGEGGDQIEADEFWTFEIDLE